MTRASIDTPRRPSAALRGSATLNLAVLALALVLGCTGRKAPIAVSITGGVMGFAACEADSVKVSTCGAIGGSAALFLGGIALIVTLLFDTEEHTLPPDEESLAPSGAIRVRTHTAPPPVMIDAGVADGAAADAPVD